MDAIEEIMNQQQERLEWAMEVDRRYRNEQKRRKLRRAIKKALKTQRLWEKTARAGYWMMAAIAVALMLAGAWGMAAASALTAAFFITVRRDTAAYVRQLERELEETGRAAA